MDFSKSQKITLGLNVKPSLQQKRCGIFIMLHLFHRSFKSRDGNKKTSTKQRVPNEASQAAENSGLKNMLVVPRENMLCISSLETGCLPRINEKPSLRKSSYPLLRRGRGEADTLVYDALQLPPGSGERWLHLPVPPFCPREGLHTLPSVSPSRSLGPVAMGSPAAAGGTRFL